MERTETVNPEKGDKAALVPQALAQFVAMHPTTAPWLVACSGGQDSVVLAHACAQAAVPFAIAHVNYHLRGAESDADQAFVRQLAGHLGVAYHVLDAPIEKKSGLQAQARALRYAFFAELGTQHGYAGTLVAHHAQDQAETLLLRMLRGTGLQGLRGMLAYNPSMGIARPLLQVPKVALVQYAAHYHLRWRDDSSNASDAYARNRVRHHLAPMLEQWVPGWQERLLATGRQAAEAWAALEKRVVKNGQTPDAWPTWVTIDSREPEPTQVLVLLVAYPGLPYTTALRLVRACADSTSADRKLETAQGVFEVEGATVYWAPPKQTTLGSKKRTAPPPSSIRFGFVQAPKSVEALQAEAAKGIYYLHAAVATPPYTLRPPQAGDRMQPLGMPGTKLVADLRQEKGVPAALARDIRLLVREDGLVLWCSLGIVAEEARCPLGAPAVQIKIS